jgi:predicted nucleotidyltransferase
MDDVADRQQTIEEITRRLVDFYHPVRIYLFGSEARGEAGPDSDLDFCVVLPDEAPRSLYGPGVRRALRGVGTAVDVVRYPLTDFEGRAAYVVSSLPAAVKREGRLLYEAGSVAA